MAKASGHAGDIAFYRVTIEQHIVNGDAVRRQYGLEMSMGKAASLAQIMGPDEDLSMQVSTTTRLVCQSCFIDPRTAIAEAWEPEPEPESRAGL